MGPGGIWPFKLLTCLVNAGALCTEGVSCMIEAIPMLLCFTVYETLQIMEECAHVSQHDALASSSSQFHDPLELSATCSVDRCASYSRPSPIPRMFAYVGKR